MALVSLIVVMLWLHVGSLFTIYTIVSGEDFFLHPLMVCSDLFRISDTGTIAGGDKALIDKNNTISDDRL